MFDAFIYYGFIYKVVVYIFIIFMLIRRVIGRWLNMVSEHVDLQTPVVLKVCEMRRQYHLFLSLHFFRFIYSFMAVFTCRMKN